MRLPWTLPVGTLLKRVLASQLGQNILTNYLAVIWMGGLSLILIPLYLKRLGSEQWGVVAICMALQGFMGLLDAGLSQIMPRDIARVSGNKVAEGRVFRVFARSYLVLAFLGLVIGQLVVPWLGSHWFNRGQGVGTDVELVLRLVLIQFFFQFANNAHMGYWNGMQAQRLANLLQCAFTTAKHAAAIGLVYLWRADALAYLLPFTLVSALEWWTNRRLVKKALGVNAAGDTSVADFRGLANEAGVIALGVVIGMLVSQVDRIVLSRSVDVASYGRYVIVASLGLAFMQLQHPLMRAFLPQIVCADASGEKLSFWVLGRGVLVLCVLPCVLVAVISPWLLQMWIGDPQIIAEGVTPLRLILGAVAVNSVYNLIYLHIIARGQGRFVLLINAVSLVILTPLVILLAKQYGIIAGGLAWMLGAVFQLLGGGIWLLRCRVKTLEQLT